jgi:hypothetical protein
MEGLQQAPAFPILNGEPATENVGECLVLSAVPYRQLDLLIAQTEADLFPDPQHPRAGNPHSSDGHIDRHRPQFLEVAYNAEPSR